MTKVGPGTSPMVSSEAGTQAEYAGSMQAGTQAEDAGGEQASIRVLEK